MDLVLVSAGLLHNVTSVTDNDPRGSDHFSVRVQFDGELENIHSFSYKISLSNNDLIKLATVLESVEVNMEDFSSLNIEEAFNKLVNLIKDNITHILQTDNSERGKDFTIVPGKRRLRSNFKSAPWWNNKCDEVIRNRRKAFREWRINPSRERFELYRHSNTICKKRLSRRNVNRGTSFIPRLTYTHPLIKCGVS